MLPLGCRPFWDRYDPPMEPEPNALYADPSLYDILHASGTADDVDALERI